MKRRGFLFLIILVTFISLVYANNSIYLSSDSPRSEVSVEGKSYSLELVSASASSATLKVSQMKEIGESYSENINGAKIKVLEADETNLNFSVSLMIMDETINLDSSNLVKKEVTINGEAYIIELLSASDNSATFKVYQIKEIAEGSSKKIGELTLSLKDANESNLKFSVSIVIGTLEIQNEIDKTQELYEKLTLTSISPAARVIVNSHKYGIELLSATDNSATLKVTDSDGKSEMKEISESVIGEINNVKIKVIEADETNLKFSVSILVYGATEGLEIKEIIPDEETGPIKVPEMKEEKEIIVCSGCLLENSCYPFGYRKNGKFCSENKEFLVQSEAEIKCENNFECSSNVCISGQCVSEGLIQRILDWFRRLFKSD